MIVHLLGEALLSLHISDGEHSAEDLRGPSAEPWQSCNSLILCPVTLSLSIFWTPSAPSESPLHTVAPKNSSLAKKAEALNPS